jgi:hypothetical protein
MHNNINKGEKEMPRKKVDVNDVKEKVNKKASESLKDTMLKEKSKKTSAKTVVKCRASMKGGRVKAGTRSIHAFVGQKVKV